jgi:NAD/NADP transhydrogenase alpha subunit
MTAAGTAKPAQVLVLGAGVAGLQAIGTARRLGALVTGYDVRPEAQDDVRSLGARFLDLPGIATDSGEDGYARQLSADEQRAQQRALDERIARFEVIITTAQVPGRRPPLLVTAEAIASMRPGSVIVDLAASTLGGNVAGSQPGRTTISTNGVTVIGASNLPATVAAAASTAYARNIAALLGLFIRDGAFRIDLGDEIQAAVVATHDGQVVHPSLARPPAQLVVLGGRP